MTAKQSEDLSVRRACREEAGGALDFYHDLIGGMQDAPYPIRWQKGVYPVLSDLRAAASEGNLYLCRSNAGDIIGAFILNHVQGAGYEKVSWHAQAEPEKVSVLHLLAVTPRLQGQGLGKRILAEAVRIAEKEGDAVIRLDTLTWNVPGQRLYESAGFVCCGDVELYYPSTGTIPFRMYERRLLETGEKHDLENGPDRK